MLFKKKKYDTNTMRLSDIMRYMSFVAHNHDSIILLYYCKKQTTQDLVIIKKFIDDELIDRKYFDRK
jgi:hypothetical protein